MDLPFCRSFRHFVFGNEERLFTNTDKFVFLVSVPLIPFNLIWEVTNEHLIFLHKVYA